MLDDAEAFIPLLYTYFLTGFPVQGLIRTLHASVAKCSPSSIFAAIYSNGPWQGGQLECLDEQAPLANGVFVESVVYITSMGDLLTETHVSESTISSTWKPSTVIRVSKRSLSNGTSME